MMSKSLVKTQGNPLSKLIENRAIMGHFIAGYYGPTGYAVLRGDMLLGGGKHAG